MRLLPPNFERLRGFRIKRPPRVSKLQGRPRSESPIGKAALGIPNNGSALCLVVKLDAGGAQLAGRAVAKQQRAAAVMGQLSSHGDAAVSVWLRGCSLASLRAIAAQWLRSPLGGTFRTGGFSLRRVAEAAA